MIRAGDVIENPVTGERIVFHQTSRETDGEAVVFETFVQPDGVVAAAHVHPKQEERFEVASGRLGLEVGGETNKKGMPNPLRLAVIAHAHFDVVRLPFPPAFVQRLGIALGAPVGRLLGYAPTYAPTGKPLAANA